MGSPPARVPSEAPGPLRDNFFIHLQYEGAKSGTWNAPLSSSHSLCRRPQTAVNGHNVCARAATHPVAADERQQLSLGPHEQVPQRADVAAAPAQRVALSDRAPAV
eukprot:6592369-Prymnesium_polylepis.1